MQDRASSGLRKFDDAAGGGAAQSSVRVRGAVRALMLMGAKASATEADRTAKSARRVVMVLEKLHTERNAVDTRNEGVSGKSGVRPASSHSF